LKPNSSLNNSKKSFSEQIESFLQKEKLWQEWKENNCPNYEKQTAKDIQEVMRNWEEYKKSGKNVFVDKTLISSQQEKKTTKFLKSSQKENQQTSNDFLSKMTEKTAKIIQENIANLRKMGMFDLNIELFKFLDLCKIEVISNFFIRKSIYFIFFIEFFK